LQPTGTGISAHPYAQPSASSRQQLHIYDTSSQASEAHPSYFNAVESVSTGHKGPEGGHLERQHKLAKEGKSGYGNKDNIGHAESYGSIIMSPPYFNALKKGG